MVSFVHDIRKSVGKYTASSIIQAHAHNSYQIIYLQEGSVTFAIDDVSIMVTAPAVVLLNCFELHRVICSSDTYSRYILELDYSAIRAIGSMELTHYMTCKNNPARIIQLTASEPIEHYFNSIMDEYSCTRPLGDCMLSSLVTQLLATLYRISNYRYHDISPLVLSIVAYVDSNYINIDSITDVCKVFNISSSTLMHLFKRHTGYSTMAYVQYSKLSHSARLLATTALSVKTIALDSGYSDINNYIRQFRKMYNLSPKAYRKSLYK